MTCGVKFIGPIGDQSGYAEASRAFVWCMHKAGIQVTVKTHNFETRYLTGDEDFGSKGKLSKNLIDRKISYNTVMVMMTPNFFPFLVEQGKRNIGYTYWETSRIPNEWIDPINKSLSEQWVPCEHNKIAFQRSGVKIPIKVVHNPLDFDLIQPRTFEFLPKIRKDISDFDYRFYSIFQWTQRKNPEGLLKAYFSAFRDPKEKVILVLKTYISDNSAESTNQIKKEINEIKRKMQPKGTNLYLPPIYLISHHLSRNEILSLHKMCDCFVLPHRGEGWGYPPFEALALGNPTIVTGYGGTNEFTKGNPLAKNIRFQMSPVFDMPWTPHYNMTMDWADPDIKHLQQLMRKEYEERNSVKEKIDPLEYMQGFSVDRIGQSIRECLE